MLELLVKQAMSLKPDAVVGLESRGFLFGPHIAHTLQIPFVPVRKKGKLPGKLRKVTYQLEYGEVRSCLMIFVTRFTLIYFCQDTFEIQEESLQSGQKVLIVDDLLATGGKNNNFY
jgi:adenine phosphoribosyltransferase